MFTLLWVLGGVALGVAIGWVVAIRVERRRARRRRARAIAKVAELGARLFRTMTAPAPGEVRGCLGCDSTVIWDGKVWTHAAGPAGIDLDHTPRPAARRNPPIGDRYHHPMANGDVASWDTTAQTLGVTVHDYAPQPRPSNRLEIMEEREDR